MTSEQAVPRFYLGLMIAAGVLLAMVLRPVFTELFLAAVLAGVMWPTMQWLSRKLGGRRNLAAGLLLVALFVLMIGPIAAIATFVVADGSEGVPFVSQAVQSEEVNELVELLPAGSRQFKAVQELLGHSTIQMTMRYAHPGPESVRDTVRLLDQRTEPGQRMGSEWQAARGSWYQLLDLHNAHELGGVEWLVRERAA